MKSQRITIPANGNCAVGRDCRDVYFDYADGTYVSYHGYYADGSTVNPNDLTALAHAAGANKVTGRTVESDGRFITGFTTYSGSYDADGVYTIDYGLD